MKFANSRSKAAFWLTIVLFIGLSACQNNNYNELAPPFSKLEGISGQWTIAEVEQTELTKRKAGFDIRVDVSETVIGGTPMRIAFDAENLTYSVDPGTTIHSLGTAGSWAFDDPEFPTRITFTPEGAAAPVDAELKQTVRPVDTDLIFEFARFCAGAVEAEYGFIYRFTRSVN